MREISKYFVFFVLIFLLKTNFTIAADVNFASNINIVVNGITLTAIIGSGMSNPFVTGSTTLTVTVPSGSFFILTSLTGYNLGPSAGTTTCVGGISSVLLVGPVGPITFSPTATPAAACLVTVPPGGGALPGGGGGNTTPPALPPLQIVVPPAPSTNTNLPTTGCAMGDIFSPTTGLLCVTPTPAISILGCTSNVGFSPTTGQSCQNNTVNTGQALIPGCGNSNAGFSPASGQSCANNFVNFISVMTYDFRTVTLRNGSSGEAVRELQRFLNRFMGLFLVVDGKFGPKTGTAVKKWQGENALVADAVVGPITKAKMNAWAATH